VAAVRYLVSDVEAAIAFYVEQHAGAARGSLGQPCRAVLAAVGGTTLVLK